MQQLMSRLSRPEATGRTVRNRASNAIPVVAHVQRVCDVGRGMEGFEGSSGHRSPGLFVVRGWKNALPGSYTAPSRRSSPSASQLTNASQI